MDPYTISLFQNLMRKQLETLKNAAIYSVDSLDKLQYVRGQIKAIEALQQELKDLLSRTEIENEQVHGDTETD